MMQPHENPVVRWSFCFAWAAVIATGVSPAYGSGKAAAVKELIESLTPRFGKEIAEEGVETLARRIESLAVKHGDEALEAVRKVGPRALKLADEAGEHGAIAVRALAKHGDEAAVLVASRPQALQLAAKYGDDAVEAIVKHPNIGEQTVSTLGKAGATALKQLDPQNGRRLAMLADSTSELGKLGRVNELTEVVARYGNRAMTFIWNHKGALATAAVLTTFLADPGPYIDGAKDLAGVVAENVVRPIVEVPGQVAEEAARNTQWTLIISLVVAAVALLSAWRIWLRKGSGNPL